MTLRELLDAHPAAFYPQTWYAFESFLDTPVSAMPLDLPLRLVTRDRPPNELEAALAPHAAHLAALYIANPSAPIWDRYLWCADVDAHGQRVYVGCNGAGFEIHRHLHITGRFALPLWT